MSQATAEGCASAPATPCRMTGESLTSRSNSASTRGAWVEARAMRFLLSRSSRVQPVIGQPGMHREPLHEPKLPNTDPSPPPPNSAKSKRDRGLLICERIPPALVALRPWYEDAAVKKPAAQLPLPVTTKRKQSSEAGADRISSRPQVSRGSLSRPQPRPRRRSAMSTERQRASHGSGTRRCRAGPRARRAARRGARGQ